MIVKLLTEHHLEFLSFKGGCTGSSESTLVKYHIVGNHMPWLINFYHKRSSFRIMAQRGSKDKDITLSSTDFIYAIITEQSSVSQ